MLRLWEKIMNSNYYIPQIRATPIRRERIIETEQTITVTVSVYKIDDNGNLWLIPFYDVYQRYEPG